MDPNHLNRLLNSTPSEWNSWKQQLKDDGISVDLSDAKLQGRDFRGMDLSQVNFQRADLMDANFSSVNLGQANLANANMRDANFNRSNLVSANVCDANIEKADFTLATASAAQFFRTNCTDAKFIGCNLYEAQFGEANCKRTDFCHANLQGCNFSESDLRNTGFLSANLTHAKFKNCRLGGNNFEYIMIDPSSVPMHDFTETMKHWHPLHWGKIRTIGKLPLFSISYSALGFAVTYINCVAVLNRSRVVTILKYPVEVPSRISWVMIASLLLAVGSTLFAVFCPGRVKEFDEIQWTEGMNRSRLQYLAEAWRKPLPMYVTFACTCAGGAIAGLLFLELLVNALQFLLMSATKES